MANKKTPTCTIESNENTNHDPTVPNSETSVNSRQLTSSGRSRLVFGTTVGLASIPLPSSLTPTFHRNENFTNQHDSDHFVERSNGLVQDSESMIPPNENPIPLEVEPPKQEVLQRIIDKRNRGEVRPHILAAQPMTPSVSGNGVQSGPPATIPASTSDGSAKLPTPPPTATSPGEGNVVERGKSSQPRVPEPVEATSAPNTSVQSLPVSTRLCFNPAAHDFVPRSPPENAQPQLSSPQIASIGPYSFSSTGTCEYHNGFESHIQEPRGRTSTSQSASQSTRFRPRRRAATVERAAREFKERKARKAAEALEKALADARALKMEADGEVSDSEYEQMSVQIENFRERLAEFVIEPMLQWEKKQGWDNEKPDETQADWETEIDISISGLQQYEPLRSPFADSPDWGEMRGLSRYNRFGSLRDAELCVGFPWFFKKKKIDDEEADDGNWKTIPGPAKGMSDYSSSLQPQRSEYFEAALQTKAAGYHHVEPENSKSSSMRRQRNETHRAQYQRRSFPAESRNGEYSYLGQQRYKRYYVRHRERPIPVEQTQAYHKQPSNSARQYHSGRDGPQSVGTYHAPGATPRGNFSRR